jgi:hypothetical protein
MGTLRLGEVYRYSKKISPEIEDASGYRNLLNLTWAEGYSMPLLERGISPIGASGKSVWTRPRPAILISSSPHKAGSEETPWHDDYDLDRGTITYFGDNKKLENPSLPLGNQALIREYTFHTSGDKEARALASPLIFFLRESVGSKKKGFVKFMGLGVLSKAELITQYNVSHGYFPNFVFRFNLLSLANEGDQFDWSWITARRSVPIIESMSLAPKAWKEWVASGQVPISHKTPSTNPASNGKL